MIENYTGKDIERWYSNRGFNPPEDKVWIIEKFEELLRDKEYKPQYFCEIEFNEMRKRRGIT